MKTPTGNHIRRFWRYVSKGHAAACWNWVGPTGTDGYGLFSWGQRGDQRRARAHRIAYELAVRPIPPLPGEYHGFCVCHVCDNPLCCNPDHLFIAPQRVNLRDASEKGRLSAVRAMRSKLSDDDVRAIRQKYLTGAVLHRELAAEYGVTQGTISKVINRKRRAHT